jgi:very-short-patch-repair endonuclease
MKLTKREIEWIQGQRKYRKIIAKSRKVTSYRKAAKQSGGERRISRFLESEGVEYNREWYFKGLYNYHKTHLLYFDFYISEYNLCIEYDGQQHYHDRKTEAAKMNDYLKNAYCAKNGINFIRIKYTDYDNIERLICEKIDSISPTKR